MRGKDINETPCSNQRSRYNGLFPHDTYSFETVVKLLLAKDGLGLDSKNKMRVSNNDKGNVETDGGGEEDMISEPLIRARQPRFSSTRSYNLSSSFQPKCHQKKCKFKGSTRGPYIACNQSFLKWSNIKHQSRWIQYPLFNIKTPSSWKNY